MKEVRTRGLPVYLRNLFLMLKKTFLRFLENQGFVISNGLALKTVFALLPALIIIANIIRIMPSFSELQESFTELLKKIIVPSSYDIIVSWINEILNQSKPISIISFFIFIYLSIDLLITLDNHVEKIWRLNTKKNIIQKLLKYWALLTATPFVLGGYFYYSGLIRTIFRPVAVNAFMNDFIYSLITFAGLTAFFFFAYFIIPNSRVNIFKALIVSSVISLTWIILRFIFIYYTMLALSRFSILYGSVAVISIFVLWIVLNWNVLLFGIEFLSVWQNKLYKFENIKFQELFLFDVALILYILSEFKKDFINRAEGVNIIEFVKNNKLNYDEIQRIFTVLENEGLLTGSKKDDQVFYLKRSLDTIKLNDIESVVFNKLLQISEKTLPRLRKISLKLNKYYFKHKDEDIVNINSII